MKMRSRLSDGKQSNNGTMFHLQRFFEYHVPGKFKFNHLIFLENDQIAAVLGGIDGAEACDAAGAGLRASQFLVLGAKVRALLQGRSHVTLEDLQALAHPTLRHRILLNFNAEAEGVSSDDVIRKLQEDTPALEE